MVQVGDSHVHEPEITAQTFALVLPRVVCPQCHPILVPSESHLDGCVRDAAAVKKPFGSPDTSSFAQPKNRTPSSSLE